MITEIRLGTPADIDSVAQLYDDLNDHLASTVNYPGWKKGVYPIRQDAATGICEGGLYVAVANAQIVGSMILRHKMESAYQTARWQLPLDENELLVIYTFVVHPKYLHCGIGSQMLAFAQQYAMHSHLKALRLDVYEKNVPAINLYKKSGFQYIDTVSLGLEACGLDWFQLYEKLILPPPNK